MSKKIRIAFIKYGGLTTGGSEKLLQIIAANLPKTRFDVTYFYSDMVPNDYQILIPSTDSHRKEYMENKGVKLIKFTLKKIDHTSPFLNWIDTDFWSYFNENDFDIIQTCRAGHKEFPFVKMRKKPIIDIIALSAGVDNQYNVARVLHLCSWSLESWVKRGGDRLRTRLVSLPIEIEGDKGHDLKSELKLEGKFVFGMHQRNSDDIFSSIPLEAYAEIENETTAFILMGGSYLYRDQVKKLNIKNVIFLDQTGDSEKIFSFLKTLDVYAHGRKDGEVNSQAIAEALYCGLPIISHVSSINNGHIECIGKAGSVVKNAALYAKEMKKIMNNNDYFLFRKNMAHKRFSEHYELEGQVRKYIDIYEETFLDPFPNIARRILSSLHYTQNIRVVLVWVYRKMNFYLKAFN